MSDEGQQKTDIMRELTEDQVTNTAALLSTHLSYCADILQAERSEKLISAYKNYKILIISVITFVFIFIIALLISMFVFSWYNINRKHNALCTSYFEISE